MVYPIVDDAGRDSDCFELNESFYCTFIQDSIPLKPLGTISSSLWLENRLNPGSSGVLKEKQLLLVIAREWFRAEAEF